MINSNTVATVSTQVTMVTTARTGYATYEAK